MKLFLCIIFFFCISRSYAQVDTIRVNFLYGSKPAKGHKEDESKWFGGLKGGHVNIEKDGRVLDFFKGKCPLFPNNKNPSGGFHINESVYWDTTSSKWTTIVVPVTDYQRRQLDSLFNVYSSSTPYDYAVFGMRCAAASYDVLSKAGIFDEYSERKDITRNFYPKLLRKRMLKWAKKNNYTVIHHDGRESRKWETDKGVL